MELWIRSQSKETFEQVKSISYYYRDNNMILGNSFCILGKYQTKDRCLEIIDEIQKLLLTINPKEAFMLLKDIDSEDYVDLREKIKQARKDNFLSFCSGSDSNSSIEILQPNVLVYEMPEK